MDTLTVATSERPDGAYLTRWKWRQGSAKQPKAGEVIVHLDKAYKDDRIIIAELGALHYLLEERHIHGANRLGAGINIEVSFGAIRKALLKGSLKKSDHGDTEKRHVAGCATFLATKYFEAKVSVLRKWRDEEPKSFENAEIAIGETFPRATIHCALLDAPVAMTRHGMRRQIARVDRGNKPTPVTENDLSNIPDKWWGTAWRWFENIFKEGSTLRRARLLPKWHAKYTGKYGPGSQYLWHPDSQAVIVVARDHGSWYVATVLHDEYAAIERDPVLVGQRTVAYRERQAMIAGR